MNAMNESADAFEKRRVGLEEAFFKDRDQKLMEKMRSELAAIEDKKQLAHVTGIFEERVLASLVQAGVRAETMTAVTLAPMIEVAWCDGNVSPEERDAILNAAAQEGIKPDTAAYGLLKSWLQQRPDAHIIAAWKEYVRDVSRQMPADAVAALKKRMIDRVTKVASAAGGFLGLATISRDEKLKIDELSQAFVE
jgi:hypothetical protein